MTEQHIERLESMIREINHLRKSAFQPAPPPPGAMPPGPPPGMPPGMMVDPNTGMPIDPNTGMPMDPAMMGGMPPPGMPPGGPPPGMPMDPSMMGGAPPPPPGGMPPEMEQIISQLMTGMDELAGMVEQQNQQLKTTLAQLAETRSSVARLEAQFGAMEKMMRNPAPFEGGGELG